MKKILTIITLLALVLLQAAPLLRLSHATEPVCALVDENSIETGKEIKDDRADDKLSWQPVFDSSPASLLSNFYNAGSSQLPPSPYLRQHTPPPNAC